MDKFSRKKRSEIMSHVHGQNTKPEEIVGKYLFSQGFRYRKNDIRYPGKPDIVLPKYRTMVFINGCFWHHHRGCEHATIPATNREYWEKKLTRNVARDREEKEELEKMGWKVIIVWTCEISTKEKREERLATLVKEIRSGIYQTSEK